jgi:hypothetical protein
MSRWPRDRNPDCRGTRASFDEQQGVAENGTYGLNEGELPDKRPDDLSEFLRSRLQKEMRTGNPLNDGSRHYVSHLFQAVGADEPIMHR